jgi:AbrB family looped-hinge helix DNA binding protein
MKRYAKIVQADARGQLVIPKEVRQELSVEEGTGFYLYIIENEGILLKIVPLKELSDHTHMVNEIEVNADKIAVKKANVAKSIQGYKKTSKGNIENIT